jgi:hypothetical protein
MDWTVDGHQDVVAVNPLSVCYGLGICYAIIQQSEHSGCNLLYTGCNQGFSGLEDHCGGFLISKDGIGGDVTMFQVFLQEVAKLFI